MVNHILNNIKIPPSTTITRRNLLKNSAILTLGFHLGVPQAMARLTRNNNKDNALNAFIQINSDNSIDLIINHSEMGQGIYTALAQVMAEELDADWDLVRVRHVPFDEAYNGTAFPMIMTGGSTSTMSEWQRLRNVGASARQMLLEAAAKRLQTDVDKLKTNQSTVIDMVSGDSFSYGELSSDAAKLDPPIEPMLKNPKEFNIIGKDVKRLEGESKVDGTAVFGIDVQLDDMLIASIAHPPAFGARVVSVDDSSAKEMAGVKKIVTTERGVAVIADTFWHAKRAKDALQIEWDMGEFANTSSSDLWQQFEELAQTPGTKAQQMGAIQSEGISATIEGEYRFPYLAHTPMEPLNATVQIKNGSCTIWTGTQAQTMDVFAVAKALQLDPANIDIHVQWLGGGFGRRANIHSDFVVDAALVAKESGLDVPIKLIWQREDDIRGGYYRPMFLHKFKVDLGNDNLPLNWQHIAVGQSIFTGTMLEDMVVHDGIDHVSVEGLVDMPYNVPNRDFSLHSPTVPIPTLWYRSVGHTHTAPVVEDIINRAAEIVGHDPIDYRRTLLAQNEEKAPRLLGVLDLLEKVSGWKNAPPPNTFRGIAIRESFESVCAYVVEINKIDSKLSFGKVTAVIDCGVAVNPENIKAQVFGSAAFALSTMVNQQITITNGGVSQSNFHDYIIAKSHQVPDIDVHIVPNSPIPFPTGVGEPGVPPFIPATMAAIRQATGQQISAFPFALDGFNFLS